MLDLITISSFAIIGLHVAMWEGMILFPLSTFFEWVTRKFKWARKPLYACAPCMASLWGSGIWFASGGGLALDYVVFVCAVSGLNYLIISIANNEEVCDDTERDG